MPFELPAGTAVTLTSATPRTETHGDNRVIAISLGLTLKGPNTILDRLSPTLRDTLYKAAEAQDVLPGVEETTPLLRTRGIEQLTLGGSLDGWVLTVAHGIGDDTAIVLGGCKVDKFRLAPHEGGSVDLLFRIGSSDVDAEELGLLCSKLGQEISIALAAPKKPDVVIDGTTAAFEADHPDASSPEDLFAASLASDRHAGDPDTPDDSGDGLGDDDVGDSEGGDPDIGAEVAAFEEGLQRAALEAGLRPKVQRRVRLVAGGASVE